MLFYLTVIIALIILLAKFIKKQSLLSGTGQQLQILEKLYFSSEQALYLVKVLDEYWVLGISSERIELLAKLSDSQALAELSKEQDKFKDEYWLERLKKVFSKDD
ncbi:flagellar biosynthetic protein FliO [Fuchsiella alkaliacetigena]|nr:flagellar biosynthetic protein FliO [Fuchsiella alkaliacetigena]